MLFWDFLVCFSVRLVRKVLLKEVTFDPGKWVKHLASIVACTPRVPLEVGVGCLKAPKITRMTYLLPILIQSKPSPFSTSKGGLDSKRKLFPHQQSPQPAPIKLPSKCCKVEASKTRTQGMGWLHARSPKAATTAYVLYITVCNKSKCVEPRALFTPRY